MTAEDYFRNILEGQTFLFPVFGDIVTFDRTLQVVDVLPGMMSGTTPAPVLKALPVLLPGGGGWDIDFSLQAGDKALVLFCGHNVHRWWTTGQATEKQNATLPDAVAIPFSKRVGLSSGVTIQSTAAPTAMKFEITGSDVKASLNGLVYSLLTHTHSGVTTGLENTGAPVPVPGV